MGQRKVEERSSWGDRCLGNLAGHVCFPKSSLGAPTRDRLPSSSSPARGVCSPTAVHGRRSLGKSSLSKALGDDDGSQGSSEAGPLMIGPEAPFQVEAGEAFEACPPRVHDCLALKTAPGANASSIRIQSIWHSITRQIFCSKTPFGSFYQAMFTKPRGGLKQSPTAPLWPMPLPYHFGRQSLDCDGDELAFRKAINLQVGYLNFLHLNRCVTPPWWICGPRPLTSGQQDVISRLRRLSGAWKKTGVIKADAMGRVAAKQERQEEVLRELLVFAESNVADVKKYQKSRCRIQNGKPVNERVKVVGKLSKGDMTGAQVIVADRIKMEGRPVFDPLPFLDEKSKRLYEDPLSCGIAPSIPDLCPPRVRVHADLDEKVKLLRLLESTGRLGFRSKADIVEGFGNGLFCVPKSTKVDRLILDGRPANLLQSPPNQFIMTMASPNAILGMHLLPGEKLLMTGDDLSNFFYTFRVNERRISRNFLDWKIPIYVAKGFSSFPEALQEEPYVYACLASLAMGDSAACEYAQTSHLAMALQCGALQSHELLTIHGKTPRCNTVGGIIIDDFCLLEKVPIDSSDSPDSNDRRSRMHDMYTKVGLQAHPDKGFSQQEVASFWGADVDGLEGLVRGNLIRAASLVWVTAEVAKLGVCSISLLEVLAGGFVSLFGFRRRMLCLLDYVYSLQGGRNQRDIISLPKPAIDELWSLVILCPLAVTDLRANFSDRIFMVDASNWGDAVVSAELSAGLQSEMHRHSLSRSCWTKMLTPFKAMLRGKGALNPNDELPGDEEPFIEHPVWEVAARGLNYKLDWKQRAKNGRHINLGELRSYLKAESLSSASCGGDVRVAIGSDSQVCLGAVCKGRSASSSLNACLRHSLPEVLGCGIYSAGGYVRSAHNPADDPTRGCRLRTAAVECPEWWAAAGMGAYSQLDNFLLSCKLSPHQVAGYPPLNEISMFHGDMFDSDCKSSLNRMHRSVRLGLRLRAKQRVADDSKNGLDHEKPPESPSFFRPEVLEIFEYFGKDQFILSNGCPWPPSSKGFLDIYSGKKGFAKAAVRYGAPWVLTIDILDGPQCDVLEPRVRQKLKFLIESGCFHHVSFAPICSSFSRAMTPAVRNLEFPQGVAGISRKMFNKIQTGNAHSRWVAATVRLCIKHAIHFWVENPDSSFIWWQPEWQSLSPLRHSNCMRIDFCTHGTPWRKRTRFFVGGNSVFSGFKSFCKGSHRHVLLRGRAKGKKACMTKLAEPYPKSLCSLLAHGVCNQLGLFRGPSSLVCRCTHRRIGEAKNPGPRKVAARKEKDPLDLDNVELIRPQTNAIGRANWEKFLVWAKGLVGANVFPSLWLHPGLMAAFLANYGRHWYSSGGALFNYRHLLVFAQRNYPNLRSQLQPAWEVVTRWQELNPVEHRRPLPISLLHAMVVIALHWKWFRVAGVLMICFFGCCRPGEVLAASRHSLLLPSDIGASEGTSCFLRILKPKPGRRGLGRVQHAKIVDRDACIFLSRIFGDLDATDLLYPGSTGAFRTRWDKLLQHLGVPVRCKLTPGSMRAGGTVHLYRLGTPIVDILWALRLRNLETLQHYLQEISTEITLIDLPAQTRGLVTSLSIMFPHFISNFKL